jgi:hypothetical protein
MFSRKSSVLIALIAWYAYGLTACYKGDPGYGNTDYPPVAPPLRTVDGGRG